MTGRIERDGDTLIVWNANAERRNALTPEYYDTVRAAVAQAAEGGIAAVILAAEGPYFCAGGDLARLATRSALPEDERRAHVERLHDVIRSLRSCPVPVIAAVEGGAAGAGVSLAFACDLVVASDAARFTIAYVKAGLVPDGGLTHALAQVLPPQTLARLTLFGDPIDAATLDRIGALSAMVPAGEALSTAIAMARRLEDGPRDTHAAIIALTRAAYESDALTQLDRERDAMAQAQGGRDAAEGIAAFLEKRRPDFRRLRA